MTDFKKNTQNRARQYQFWKKNDKYFNKNVLCDLDQPVLFGIILLEFYFQT